MSTLPDRLPRDPPWAGSDLTERWALGRRDEEALAGTWDLVRTSAKSGEGVEDVFRRLARATLTSKETRP